MNILGKTRIFINEFNNKKLYSTSISNKQEDGTYKNMSITVQFPKNTELENKSEIEITKGFLSWYEDKNKTPKIKIVVQEFKQENISKQQDFGIIYDGDSDSLPF